MPSLNKKFMQFSQFTFSHIDDRYGGHITFETGETAITIEDYKAWQSLTKLLNGIADCWSGKKQLVQIRMEADTTLFDIILIAFPSDFLKIEIYDFVLWECYQPDRYTPPPPVLSGFFDYHELAFLICEEIQRQGASAFYSPEYPYPAEALERLRKMMVG
jgi:hypothetical protein